MCGIFGFVHKPTSSLSPLQELALIKRIAYLSAKRGVDAAGFATQQNDTITILKQPGSMSRLLQNDRAKEFLDNFVTKATQPVANPPTYVYSLIGHTRLATHGDPAINTNNQPLTYGSCVGVHNGICTNQATLLQIVPTQKWTAESDTVSILAFLDQAITSNQPLRKAIKSLYKTMAGAASLAFYSQSVPILTLTTNTGSLYYQETADYWLFASEATLVNWTTGLDTATKLQPKDMLFISLLTGEKINNPPLKSKLPLFKVKSVNTGATLPSHKKFTNSSKRLAAYQPNYQKIATLKRCTRCILPATMPLISFDSQGVCNYCRDYTAPRYQGESALRELVKPHRRRDGKSDVIVAFSGGRDSAYGLHYVKKELDMQPLAYTYDWGMVTDLGRRNQARLTGKLGVEHVIVAADLAYKRANIRSNVLAWLKKPDLGIVPLFMAGDKQAEYFAQKLKQQTNIQLAIYCRGNELENEEFKWGHCGIKNGSPGGVLHNLSWLGKTQLALYYGGQYLQNPAYFNHSLFDTVFAYFVAYLMPLQFVYLWHYIPWDEQHIINTLTKEYDWESKDDGKVTWRIDDGSVPFYNFIYYHAQGFTENDTFRSNQIRAGVLDRATALKLVEQENQPDYEGMTWYFDTLDLNGEEVLDKILRMPTLY